MNDTERKIGVFRRMDAFFAYGFCRNLNIDRHTKQK